MKWMKRALIGAMAFSCSGCGGNVMGSALKSSALPVGAVIAPQTYYLPKGEIPITIKWDQAEGSFAYTSDFASVSVADQRWGAFRLWHRHKGLSDEEATVAVDPNTMLLSKASSTYTPQAATALEQSAKLITQAVKLRDALAGGGTQQRDLDRGPGARPAPPKCQGITYSGRIPIAPGRSRAVTLLPIKTVAGCAISLQATITPIDKTELRDDRPVVSSPAEMARKCANVVCFRLPRLYEVKLSVATSPRTETPAIPPFTVVAPDLATIGFVEFPTGSFAAKSVSLDLANGMLQSYSVKNSSAAVGVLQVATSALLVATAVADIN